MQLPFWNPDGIKVGLCAAPPVGQPVSLLALSNSCAIADALGQATARFDLLYKRRAHLHHFTQYMEAEALAGAREVVRSVASEYNRLKDTSPPPEAAALLAKLVSPSKHGGR